MPAIIKVSIEKPTPTSKVGINFDVIGGRMYTSSVNPTGLCASTGLVVGQELLSVNGVSAQDKKVDDMKTIIGEADKTVVFSVKEQVSFLLKVERKGSSINYSRDSPPKILRSIPKKCWESIYNAVSDDLLQVLAKVDAKYKVFVSEMKEYRARQMAKGYIGFGTESGHEGQVLAILFAVSAASSNAVLVGSNVLALANALLNPHGILAQLVIEERSSTLTKNKSIPPTKTLLPIGLSFSKMFQEEDTVDA